MTVSRQHGRSQNSQSRNSQERLRQQQRQKELLYSYQQIVSDLQSQQRWCILTDAEEKELNFYRNLIDTFGHRPMINKWSSQDSL